MAHIVLPPKYYRSHFFEFLDFVERHYAPILNAEHLFFISEFRQLSEDSQCAYIRMVNRKGLIFDRKGFEKYTEIENVNAALRELQNKKFVEPVSKKNTLDLLTFLPKAKLRQWLQSSLFSESISPDLPAPFRFKIDMPATLSRDELVELGMKNRLQLDFEKMDSLDQLMARGFVEPMQYLLFLYFGRIQKSLTLYTLRDLGIRQSDTLKSEFKPRFTSASEAEAEYFFAQLLDLELADVLEPELTHLFDQAREFKNLPSSTQHLKDDLFLRIAEYKLDSDNEMALIAQAFEC